MRVFGFVHDAKVIVSGQYSLVLVNFSDFRLRKVIFSCLRDNSAYPAAGRELCGARGVKADSPIRRGGQAQQFIFHFHFSILIHHLVTFATMITTDQVRALVDRKDALRRHL